MTDQVVHFEIIGADAAALRSYYGELFDWTYEVGDALTDAVSAPGEYGSVQAGINGGVGGGAGHEPRVLFYVGVSSVTAALDHAERLGGTRQLGPVRAAEGDFAVGQFTDPEGNLIGVAGPA